MQIRRADYEPDYRALIHRCLDELAADINALEPGMNGREGSVIISSPSAVTPFHLDHEHNFLLQIRGRKTVSVFPREDRELLPEEHLEGYFSGKKKTHTCKTGLLVNEQGQLRGVTRSYPGRVHDLTVFRQSGLLELLPVQSVKVADKGFDGLHQDLPEHNVVTPHKARRNHKLDEAEKWANRDVSRQRIVVENTICELKHFKVLVTRFRQAMERLDDAVRAVIALINPRIARRLATASAD